MGASGFRTAISAELVAGVKVKRLEALWQAQPARGDPLSCRGGFAPDCAWPLPRPVLAVDLALAFELLATPSLVA